MEENRQSRNVCFVMPVVVLVVYVPSLVNTLKVRISGATVSGATIIYQEDTG